MTRFRYGRESSDWDRDERGYQGSMRDDWRRRYEGYDEDRSSSRGDWRGDPYRMDRDHPGDEYRRSSGFEGRRGEGSRWESDHMRGNEDRGGYAQDYGGDWHSRYDQGGYRGAPMYENPGYGGGSGRERYGQGYGGYRGQGYGSQGYGSEGYGFQGQRRYGMQGYGNYGNPGSGGQSWGQSSEYRGEGRYGQARGGNEDYPQWRGQDDDWTNSASSFGRGAYREDGGFGGQASTYGSMGSSRRGRPPKGYTRSDERIREDVSDRLGDRMDASDISVEVKNGEVTLSGTVRDRWMKHQIELIADCVGGVKEVNNQIRVQREGESERTTITSSSGSRSKSTNDTSTSNPSSYAQNRT